MLETWKELRTSHISLRDEMKALVWSVLIIEKESDRLSH